MKVSCMRGMKRLRKPLRRMKRWLASWLLPEERKRFAAMKDALVLLASRGVPVYFCESLRKAKPPERHYSPSALRRMAKRRTFPKMLEDIEASEADLRELFGEKYSAEYVKELGRIPPIVEVAGRLQNLDCRTPYVNVVGGMRLTVGQPAVYRRTLHVYGRCDVFGYAVEDGETLPSQIQRLLIEKGHADIRVVNHGLWGDGGRGASVERAFLDDAMGLHAGDMVLIVRTFRSGFRLRQCVRLGVRHFSITQAWHESDESRGCFFHNPAHMSAPGIRVAARLIVEQLLAFGFSPAPCREDGRKSNMAHFSSYLRGMQRVDSEDVRQYVAEVKAAMGPGSGTIGAIMMNANPFTNGHRYLVEQAKKEVDRLLVFVVKSDWAASITAEDRLAMVKAGVADIEGVTVVPTGSFFATAKTFPEYGLKDIIDVKRVDATAGVRVFRDILAPQLGISVRFAGEEPTDPITARYNDAMREEFPKKGIRFREFPRYALSDKGLVSGTTVRKLLAGRNWDELSLYVPAGTLRILKERYA